MNKIIIPINTSMQEDIHNFFVKHWGSTQMVVSSRTYDCAELEGFVYMKVNQIHDAVTRARKQKSTIPLSGYDKIPLLDEIILTKKLIEEK